MTNDTNINQNKNQIQNQNQNKMDDKTSINAEANSEVNSEANVETNAEAKCPMSWHGAKMDFSNDMSYSDYLGLQQILTAQHPLSPNHNELLFIIQHQTSELWIKLMLHELHAVREHMKANNLPPAFKMLSRVARIMDQLVHAWDVLATMTPSEYTAVRPYLGNSSGFQSHQYRELEFLLGNKNASMLQVHASNIEGHQNLHTALHAPSIYDEAIFLLARNGFQIDSDRLNSDWTKETTENQSVQNAWLQIYQNPEQYWQFYDLAEKFVDLETTFRNWRFRHVTTVERIIGFKTGTGGTAGVSYLRKMLDVVLFPELFSLRTKL